MYDAAFYATIRAGAQQSAAAVVPLLVDLFEPKRVIDVGCGEGWWGEAFVSDGVDVLGIDGAVLDTRPVRAGLTFAHHDLTTSFAAVGRFDMALALEVGEHLPEWRADGYIADLCAVAPVVVFSAAIPGQGGVGHINEQWPGYWVEKFNANGYAVSGALRWQIWEDRRVENWYCAPDDAEILTSVGWQRREQLAVGDSVLTYDMDARSVGWEPLLAINAFGYDGPLIELAGRWRTTPDHRWPVLTQLDTARKTGPRMKLARDVGRSDRLIQCAESYRAPRVSVLDARDAEVLGWIVTDGSFLVKANGRPQGVIYQSPKKYLDEIVELLGAEGCPPREDPRPTSHGCATITVRVSLLDRLIAAGFRSKHDLPELVTKLGPVEIDAMWHAMLKAEGSDNGGSWVFAQIAGPVFDAFQILSLLRGNRVNLVGEKHSVGGTGVGFKSGRTVAAKVGRAVDYHGTVWCPTTPSGTWVMRQNGAAVITGNCQNLLVAVDRPDRYPDLFAGAHCAPIPVVHPVLWDSRR